MLNILSVSCCVSQGPGRKRELSPDSFNRGIIIYRTSYRGVGRAKTGDGETTQRLSMAGICPSLGWRYKGKRGQYQPSIWGCLVGAGMWGRGCTRGLPGWNWNCEGHSRDVASARKAATGRDHNQREGRNTLASPHLPPTSLQPEASTGRT